MTPPLLEEVAENVLFAPADEKHVGYVAICKEVGGGVAFTGSPVAEGYARWVCKCHGVAHEITSGGITWDGPNVDIGNGAFPTAKYRGHSFRDYGRPVRIIRVDAGVPISRVAVTHERVFIAENSAKRVPRPGDFFLHDDGTVIQADPVVGVLGPKGPLNWWQILTEATWADRPSSGVA